MNSTAEHRTCPNCGAAIPANAPQGVCPKCLMAAAAVSTEDGQTGGKRPEPPSLERLAAAFPQLEVIEFIGQGGMGAVYKARQKQLDRIVALKVLPPGIGDDPAFAERFTREAKALAKLLHPNIVALFEFGQADGIYYLLMEYVDGVSLGQLLRASRVSAREALAIVPQICDALQYAHDQGIVHRDIKPENILLDRRGRVKVADFGLAKLVAAGVGGAGSLLPAATSQTDDGAHGVTGPTDALTDAGKVMGTPAYMAPEQREHPAEVDHRADIYALGVVFYQMLTGELPGKRMEPPSRKVQIDVRLDEVVMRALEKKPELRYQQVSEVKTMVETIVATPPSNSRREEAQDQSGRASESPAATMVRSERARLAVQEFPGARVISPAMGEVTLYTDRLVISSGYNQRSIPLADIHALGEAVMPFWLSPGPHPFAAVDFDEAGQRRRLVFLAGSSIFRLPGDTRLHAAEWLAAIQRAIKSGAGRDVLIAHGPTVVPVRAGQSLLWLLVALLAAISLIASLLSKRGPGSLSVTNAALLSGAFMLMPALALFVVYIVRSCWLRGTVKRPLGCATGSGGVTPGSDANKTQSETLNHRPWPLIIVAGLFMLTGCSAAWDIGSGFHKNIYSFNSGLLALSVGIGLLRLRHGWRVAALIMIWLPFILGVCLGIVALFGQFTFVSHAKFFGHELTGLSRFAATIVACTLIPILLVWMSWVLTRPDVKALFQRRGSDRPWMEWAALPVAIFISFVLSGLAGPSDSAQSSGANSLAGDSNTAVFGPVVERTLPLSDLGYSWCLDLDADRIIPMPANLTEADWSSGISLPDGIIVIAPNADQPCKVAGTGTPVVPLLDGVRAWETMRPSETTIPEEPESGQTVTVTGERGALPLTFAFITVRGMRGLLQITDFTESPRGVKIRYKLVGPEAAASPALPAPPTGASAYTFGPAITQVIQSGETGTNLFLDLDTGQLLTPPKAIRALFHESYSKRNSWELDSDPRAGKMREWLRRSGANLMLNDSLHGSEQLEIREAVALAPTVISNNVVVPFGFDQADANYLATRIKPMLESFEVQIQRMKTLLRLQPSFDPRLNTRRDSFCFRTHKGTVGILQILNSEDNPSGLRIRYKLVVPQRDEGR